MTKLTGSTRTYLRGLAHHLKAVVLVGQKGVTDSFIEASNEALEEHELIKVRFNSFKEDKKTLAKEIADKTQSELIGQIGNIAIYYRQQADEDKRKIQLPSTS